MEIVYLIGNGFDLNLGIKTAYKDFYGWYLAKVSDKKDSIVNFINHISKMKDVDNDWSDLEIALGKYTIELRSSDIVQEMNTLHKDLTYAISDFIKEQESIRNIEINEDTVARFEEYFRSPESSRLTRKTDGHSILEFRSFFAKVTSWQLNIITFNYSSTLQKILDFNNSKNIGAYFSNGAGVVKLNEIEHIHGTTADRLIIGVNDISQVENEKLHSTTTMNRLIKTRNNAVCGEGQEDKCMNWIRGANLICLFGLSFGKSDKLWWDNIVVTMMNRTDIRLIIFNYNEYEEFGKLDKIERQEYKTKIRENFLASSERRLDENTKNNLCGRIYICHNTDMFKI